MASTTLTVQVPLIAGTTIVGVTAVASSETCTIAAATAQGTLNMVGLFLRITASGGSVTPTINVGTRYSDIGLGAKTCTVIASSASAIIGGKDFTDARFMNTANNVIFSFIGTGTAAIEAYMSVPSNIGY